MNKIFLIAAITLQTMFCPAQSITGRPDIGDPFPYLKLDNVLFQKSPIDLAAYKGKLLIIDFWGLNCPSCITAMPELDSLQKVFKDRLQIVMVTKDKRDAIEKFFERRKFLRPDIPIVVGDTVLSSIFPYKYVPRHIWISEQGKILHITGGHNTNGATLSAYFAGNTLNFTRANQFTNFDPFQPIWKEGGGRLAHHVKYYSMVTGFVIEHQVGLTRIAGDNTIVTGLLAINADIISLYKYAYGGLHGLGEFASNDRIIVEVKDKSRLIVETDPLKSDNWRVNNSYCYDAVVPPMSEADFCKFMQDDLKQFFPYDVKVEKRKVKLASGKRKKMKMLVIKDKLSQ